MKWGTDHNRRGSRPSRCARIRIWAQRVAVPAAVLGLFLGGSGAWAQGDVVFSQEEICKQKYQTGLEYMKNQRLHDAAAAFSEVKEACPSMVDAYLNLGFIQTQLSQYTEAIATFEDALDQDPQNLDIKEAMAFALSSAGELDDAEEMYLDLHEARPEKSEIMKNLAFVYEKKGKVAEAIMLYNRLVELGHNDPNMVSQAGQLALNEKLFFPAVTFYSKLYEYNPENIGTLGILGGYYYKIRFKGQAIPYYEKILELEPDHEQALLFHKILVDCYKSTKQWEKSAEHAEYVLSQEPDNTDNYYNLGSTYKDAGNLGKAIETIRRGLEIDPNAGSLWYLWGTVMEAEGRTFENRKRYDDAIDSYEEAKEKFQRVIDLNDPRFGRYARQQLDRMDQLIERVYKLKERDEMGGF